MRVCHVISGLDVGGAEMMLYKLLESTDRMKFSPTVVSLTTPGVFGERLKGLEVPVYALGMRPGRNLLKAYVDLRRYILSSRPDLIQGWMYHGNVAAQIVGFTGRRIPVLWNIRHSLYSISYEKTTTAMIIRLGKKLSRFPSRIIYNSRTSAEHHEKFGFFPKNSVLLPNGFNTNTFTPSQSARDEVRRELGLNAEVPLIGLIGRYHPMKDHGNFLRAAQILLRCRPDVHFVMVGKNVSFDNPSLAAQINNLGISPWIHLLGSRSDIPRLTAALDIATSSSYSEGFPNVIGEAMSCGVPCTVTDVGDSRWIVGDTGLVVPPKDSEALADALRSLIDSSPEYRLGLGVKARTRIVERFSMVSVVKKYEKLYEQVFWEAKR